MLEEQEWSYFFDVKDWSGKAEKITLTADEESRQALSRRLQVEKVKSLTASLTISKIASGRIVYVNGQFEAVVEQNCVITGDMIETPLQETVEGWFADKESAVSFVAAKRDKEAMQSVSKANLEVELLSEEEDPEPIIDNKIDLGELVTQFLSLAIPAYPHKEGAAHDLSDEDFSLSENESMKKNPFEALKDWKENR